ncbi:hypothetical protein CHS0354_014733 [Potamilus streckersoni]|uniref:G-protein coupled receptors family 1 profile domain-containing protein n=1 Tax=Potamilus streckersoni TaxID=2493646 RepID=A0AAE0SQP6_9BIVA|nr:hypothetical protein CHS0354_014733 [Potamilus streckersoni]
MLFRSLYSNTKMRNDFMSLLSTVSEANVTKTTDEEKRNSINAEYAKVLLPLTSFFCFLGLLGLVGNSLVLCVYGKGKQLKNKNYRRYILCLALIDIVTCMSLIPAEAIKHRNYFSFEQDGLCKAKCFFNVFAAASASFCLLAIGFDRYCKVYYPLSKYKHLKSSSKLPWCICVCSLLLGVLIAVPSAIMCGTDESIMETSTGERTEVYLCGAASEYKYSIYRSVYRIGLCVLQAIVSIIMIAIYIRIGMKIKYHLRRISRGGTVPLDESDRINSFSFESKSRFASTNITLLCVVSLIYIITYAFYIGLSFVNIINMKPMTFAFFSLFFRLYFVQSVINPFLYAKMDQDFRDSCMKMFCFARKDDDNTSKRISKLFFSSPPQSVSL